MNKEIQEALAVLKKGGVVAYPTDTAYGFAVDATNIKAINRLYKLKGRDAKKPVTVIFPSLTAAKKIVQFNKTANNLAQAYWPGGVTLVLPLKSNAKNWQMLSAKTKTLGVRHPDNKIAMDLVKALNRPITTTSANVSGKPTTYSIKEIQKQYAKQKHKPDFYLDGGQLKKNSISTMLHLEGRHVTLIREGIIKYHDIIKNLK